MGTVILVVLAFVAGWGVGALLFPAPKPVMDWWKRHGFGS